MRWGSRNIVVPMKHTAFLLALMLGCNAASAQIIPDTARRIVLEPMRDVIADDATRFLEDAPLDHDRSRGFTIVGHDRDLQLQLQASVRDLAVLDLHRIGERQSFTTWGIPTGSDHHSDPTFHNDLKQTRLALIGKRVTDVGTIILRIETDFAGPDGFRIRHAYGEWENLLVGQTWSLFSHVTLQPLTIDINGPLGIAKNLTPQVRYRFQEAWPSADVTVGVEFPDHTYRPWINEAPIDQQVFPEPSVRVTQRFTWGELQSSFIVPFLSSTNQITTQPKFSVGWGLSASMAAPVSAEGTVRAHGAIGQGIADLFATFAGRGMNATVNELGDPQLPLTLGGFVSYEHAWTPDMRSTATVSGVQISQDPWIGEFYDTYYWGWAAAGNMFWDVYDGLHAGVEITVGGRVDKNAAWGTALRVAGLVYYEL